MTTKAKLGDTTRRGGTVAAASTLVDACVLSQLRRYACKEGIVFLRSCLPCWSRRDTRSGVLSRRRGQEAVQQAICIALVCYRRLQDQGRESVAYPTPLIQMAIRHYWQGREVGVKMNCKDCLSPYAQSFKRFVVVQISMYSEKDEGWKELVVEDRKAGPADTAAARLDFSDWLETLQSRKRRIALALATGLRTKAAAKRFRSSPGRISQLRNELRQLWQDYTGEN